MITQFKIFENLETDIPNIGDYVKLNITRHSIIYNNAIKYMNSSICKVHNYSFNNQNELIGIVVIFDSIPVELEELFNKDRLKYVELNEILAFGKTIEELELKTNANKYNL